MRQSSYEDLLLGFLVYYNQMDELLQGNHQEGPWCQNSPQQPLCQTKSEN